MAAARGTAPRLSPPEKFILTIILGVAFVTFPLWFPFYVVQAVIRQKYREYKHRRLTKLPRPLPPQRLRRLSIDEPPPVITPTDEKSSTFSKPKPDVDPEKALEETPPQRASSLFRLPPEIRAQIWEEATFDGTLHLVAIVGRRRIMAVPCTSVAARGGNIDVKIPTSCPFCFNSRLRNEFRAYYYPRIRQNFHYQTPFPGWYRYKPSKANPAGKQHLGLLSLPLVSRQLYRETIDLLYARPTFQPVHPSVFGIWKDTILPQRFDVVSSLRILILLGPAWRHQFPGGGDEARAFDEFMERWAATWTATTAMPRLKSLHCELRSPTRFVGWHDDRVKTLLETLQPAGRMNKINVTVACNDPDDMKVRVGEEPWEFELKIVHNSII